ncbi:MAG: hypothetical protein Q8P42_05100 [Gallionella sp.]|nr:hypothetical protein [Gallionella sp.]
MRVRKIIGKVAQEHISHSIAKLENGRYAVGRLTLWQAVESDDQFETLDDAFEHWLATLPLGGNALRENAWNSQGSPADNKSICQT